MRIIVTILLLCTVMGAQALELVPDSSELHFLSVKKGAVGEVHSFGRLGGSISDSGQADITIDLASVDTGIDIRDQRIRQYLLEIGQFPQAVFTTTVDIERVRRLKPGQSYNTDLTGELSLHGMSVGVKVLVRVVALTDGWVLIDTRQPIMLSAADFNLVDGITKLQELARLPSIDRVIPVTFSIVFH